MEALCATPVALLCVPILTKIKVPVTLNITLLAENEANKSGSSEGQSVHTPSSVLSYPYILLNILFNFKNDH